MERFLTRLPPWMKKPPGPQGPIHRVKRILRKRGLNTVCESARCPNMGECFAKPTATFLILGDVCTRRCSFCAVDSSVAPAPLDPAEPANVAGAVMELGLSHVVVTSVTRDDLDDGGAAQFALTIRAIKDTIPDILVEVLTPDFNGDERSIRTVLDAGPDIFNHNIETVPALYKEVRPGADYQTSLKVLARSKASGVVTKSGIMVGFGERVDEVRDVLCDLLNAGCDAVTIGQYLRPTREKRPVREYIDPALFKEYEAFGLSIGLKSVYSGPFVRSSYNAERFFAGDSHQQGDR
jgi:lipoic acid synthetase